MEPGNPTVSRAATIASVGLAVVTVLVWISRLFPTPVVVGLPAIGLAAGILALVLGRRQKAAFNRPLAITGVVANAILLWLAVPAAVLNFEFSLDL